MTRKTTSRRTPAVRPDMNARTLDAIRRTQLLLEVGLDGTVTAASEGALTLLGYGKEELVGRHHGLLLPADVRDGAGCRALWEKLARGEPESGHFRYLTKDGKTLWLQAMYLPVADRSGRIEQVVITGMDITREKLRLLEEQAEMKVRMDIMNLTSIYSEGDKRGDITFVNDKFCEVSQYDRSEAVGKPHNLTRHPDMPKEVFKQMWATIGRGGTFRGVVKNRKKDGTPYYVDAVIAPVLGENGKPRKYIGIRYDITDAEIERHNMKGVLDAIDSTYAYAEFDTTGNILRANNIWQQVLGYQATELNGLHHRVTVEPTVASSPAYTRFWEDLNAGKVHADVYKRITRAGQEVWLQAIYSPIKDEVGRVSKVVCIATDVTQQKMIAADNAAQLGAISKSQAVVEFDLDGRVLTANENFRTLLGYSLEEIRGQHHSMFVDPADRASTGYRLFWEKLAAGEYDSGQYRRLTKDGREIWIQASYNPVLDLNGKPCKVVKYATDVTAQVRFTRELEAAVAETQKVVEQAISGDLAARVSVEGKSGDLQALSRGINSLLDAMASLVVQITQAAREVQAGTEEIARGNSSLSQRTEEQASSLEETASSMEEMTSTVKQTADNAAQANQLALAAREQADKGGSVVSAAIAAMAGINAASKKIADIIGVIDEIAFQTNLLALNAAVEAARAGEQGRGFAVVATEVRNLAGRSSTAAKEIKALIQDSVAKVEEGSTLVDASGKTLEEINSAVKRVADIVAEMAAATTEQASGIEQVNKAVMQMDEMTQQNAALVEQAASASEAIVEQVQALMGLVSRFRTDEAESSAAAPLPVTPPASRAPAQERRGPGRPWSQGHGSPEAGTATRPALRAAAGGTDADWQEF